jgi:hypothetical protein
VKVVFCRTRGDRLVEAVQHSTAVYQVWAARSDILRFAFGSMGDPGRVTARVYPTPFASVATFRALMPPMLSVLSLAAT